MSDSALVEHTVYAFTESTMQTFYVILAVVCVIFGVLSTLTHLTFLLAGSANAAPGALHVIKWQVWVALLCGLACAGGGVWLIVRSHPLWAAVVGGLPVLLFIAGMIWLHYLSNVSSKAGAPW